MTIAICLLSPTVHLMFRPHQCSFDDYTIDSKAPKWFHYFLCGYKGMTEFLRDVKKVNLEEKHIGKS